MNNTAEVKPILSSLGNPMVHIRIGDANALFSVAEARQFALGILSASERASILNRMYDSLRVSIGEDEANNIVDIINESSTDEC